MQSLIHIQGGQEKEGQKVWPISCSGWSVSTVFPHIRGGPGPNAASADSGPPGVRITGCARSQEVQGRRVGNLRPEFAEEGYSTPRDQVGRPGHALWALALCNAEACEHCVMCMSVDHDTRACEDYDRQPGRGQDSEVQDQRAQWEVKRQGCSAGKTSDLHQLESVELHISNV
jgi:hypothetical protein